MTCRPHHMSDSSSAWCHHCLVYIWLIPMCPHVAMNCTTQALVLLQGHTRPHLL
jgi:hypothetical protein